MLISLNPPAQRRPAAVASIAGAYATPQPGEWVVTLGAPLRIP